MTSDLSLSDLQPKLTFVMHLRVEVAKPLELGQFLANTRRVVQITGGSFEGPILRGMVLAGGADHQFTRPDGTVVLDARYTLETESGDLISVINKGFRHRIAELTARLTTVEQSSPFEHYFMTTPLFETSAPALQWMTRFIFVGQGERKEDCVLLNMWMVGRGL